MTPGVRCPALVVAIASGLLLVGCASRGSTVSSGLPPAAEASALWPCSTVPSSVLEQLGVSPQASTPPGGTATPEPVPICVFYNPTTTLGITVTVGEGTPSGETSLDVPGAGLAYEQILPPNSYDAAALSIDVPAGDHASWVVAASCRSGCTATSLLPIAEMVVGAVAPHGSQLVGTAPGGARYWNDGGKNVAVASNG